MVLAPADSWKLVLAFVLVGAVLASARVRPPRRSMPTPELRRLVIGAVSLYGVGLASSLTHHTLLAVVLCAGGSLTSALAAWLSRGSDPHDPPRREEPAEEQPPPAPGGAPRFDWPSFQRDFEDYARRERQPVETR